MTSKIVRDPSPGPLFFKVIGTKIELKLCEPPFLILVPFPIPTSMSLRLLFSVIASRRRDNLGGGVFLEIASGLMPLAMTE